MSFKISFILNNELISESDVNPALSLLDYLRKKKKLTGVKEGCKEGDCGACTVLLGELNNNGLQYKNVVSCLFPLANARGKHVVTIEGLNSNSNNIIQESFIEEGAAQCGFCTPGFIVSTTAYLLDSKLLNFNNAINYVSGNICRCTGYAAIERALNNIAKKVLVKGNTTGERIKELVEYGILPAYFLEIPQRIKNIQKFTDSLNGRGNSVDYFVAGGTDLYVQKYNILKNNKVHFLNNSNNEIIAQSEENIEIGASVTFEMFKNSEIIKRYFPRLSEQLELVASMPVRNMATIAGNIVNASPIGDLTIILIALNAELLLINNKGKRKIKLEKFYKGYKQLNKDEDEIIEKIIIKKPNEEYYFNFEKVAKRKYLDIASVNSAAYFVIRNNKFVDVRISAGGVAPTPLFLSATSRYLENKELSPEVINEAADIIQSEISPISDVRGSEEYKRILLNRLFFAHFVELFPQKIELEELI